MVDVSHRHCSHSRICLGVLEGTEMNKQPEALRLAELLESPGYGYHTTPAQCAFELRRLHEANQVMLEALKGLDDAYCRAGLPLSKDERHEDRMRLIAARAAIAKGEQACKQ